MIHAVRPLAAVSALLAAAAVVTACSSSTQQSAQTANKTLLFSPAALAIPTLKTESETITSLAEAAGWKVSVVDPNFQATTQVQQIQQGISSGQAGAVWVVPVDAKALSSVISLARSKKVPIAVTGEPSDFGFSGAQKGIVFDAAGADEYGEAIGKNAAECIAGKLGGTAKVLIVSQSGTQSGAEQQLQGIKRTLAAAAPGATIVGSGAGDTRAQAQTKVSQLLQSHPDADAVIATSDEGSLGALGAYTASGKQLPCLISGGGGEEARSAQQAGSIYALVAFDYAADAQNVFSQLQELVKNPTAEGAVGSVPITVLK